MEDAGRDEVQDGLLAAHHQRVAGVVAALEADHHVGVLGEEIDDLSLALVAPLGSDDDHVRHVKAPWLDYGARTSVSQRHGRCGTIPGRTGIR